MPRPMVDPRDLLEDYAHSSEVKAKDGVGNIVLDRNRMSLAAVVESASLRDPR
jgi:hypothetical protein